MHPTQISYAKVKAVKETIRQQLFSLGRDWTEEEYKTSKEIRKDYEASRDAMIEWAMGRLAKLDPAQFKIVSHLDEATKNSYAARERLATICYKLSGK